MQGSDPFSDKTRINPFQAPKARVEDPYSEGPDQLLDEPTAVEAGRGFSWFSEGYGLFKQAPGIWVAAVLVWFLINLVLGFIPLASNLINPVLMAGLIFGCHSQAKGGAFALEHLFEGFRRNFGPLVLVGVLTLVGALLIVGFLFVMMLATGMGSALMEGQSAGSQDGMVGIVGLLAFLIVLALSIPLTMAIWFAPTLVILHGLPAFQAMTLSFRGCLRNLLPFLAYGIAGLGLAILATIPLGLGWLVLLPVIFCSTYAAYREIFLE